MNMNSSVVIAGMKGEVCRAEDIEGIKGDRTS